MRRKGFIFFSCGFFRSLSPAVFWCLKAWPSIVPSLTFLESLGGKGVNHSVRIRCRCLGLCALPAGASEYQSWLMSLLYVCEINLGSPHTHTHIHTFAVAKAHSWQDRAPCLNANCLAKKYVGQRRGEVGKQYTVYLFNMVVCVFMGSRLTGGFMVWIFLIMKLRS